MSSANRGECVIKMEETKRRVFSRFLKMAEDSPDQNEFHFSSTLREHLIIIKKTIIIIIIIIISSSIVNN